MPEQRYLYQIFLSFILLCAFYPAHGKPLVVGVAPSLPKPVAELAVLEKQVTIKKSKFAAKQRKLDKQAVTHTALNLDLPTKAESWENLLNYISEKSGLAFQYEHATSQLDFELKLAKGYYDLAYVTPLQFHAFKDYPGYQAQVKRKAQPIRGMMFSKKNGSVSSLSELRGATLAFPGALNFAGSVVPRESLSKLKFEFVPQFLPDEESVFRSLAKGEYLAGAGTGEGYRALPPEIRNSLRVIWDSPGFSPYPLVAHPRVDFFSLTKLKRSLVNMTKDETGRQLLKYIFVEHGFEIAKNSDWDEIALIDLNRLNNTPQKVHVKEPAGKH